MGKAICSELRWKIIFIYKDCLCRHQVRPKLAKRHGGKCPVTLKTIYNVIKLYDETGDFAPRPRPGKSRIVRTVETI